MDDLQLCHCHLNGFAEVGTYDSRDCDVRLCRVLWLRQQELVGNTQSSLATGPRFVVPSTDTHDVMIGYIPSLNPNPN